MAVCAARISGRGLSTHLRHARPGTLADRAGGPWSPHYRRVGLVGLAITPKAKAGKILPSLAWGWFALLGGLCVLVLSRNQDIWFLEVASEIPVLAGCVLLLAGWKALRILAFPIGFLIFSAPSAGVDGRCRHHPVEGLDLRFGDEPFVYALGFPIAQNGVVIQIGPYQLWVQDACSGMNSIFALSAIGVFYVYAFRWDVKIRALLLMALIIPITIAANFLRVLTLVLIAYYFGVETIEGVIHDLTGIALFVVAVALMLICDGLINFVGSQAHALSGDLTN